MTAKSKAIISEDDILEIYNRSQLRCQLHCVDDNGSTRYVNFDIYDKYTKINEKPVMHTYKDDALLRPIASNLRGRCAIHDRFYLDESQRRKKYATKIHNNELIIYKANGFKQIHLSALGDGVVAWAKLKYRFVSEDDHAYLKIMVNKYLVEIKDITQDDADKVTTKDVQQIPTTLLASTEKHPSFTDWLKSQPTRHSVEMYKDV